MPQMTNLVVSRARNRFKCAMGEHLINDARLMSIEEDKDAPLLFNNCHAGNDEPGSAVPELFINDTRLMCIEEDKDASLLSYSCLAGNEESGTAVPKLLIVNTALMTSSEGPAEAALRIVKSRRGGICESDLPPSTPLTSPPWSAISPSLGVKALPPRSGQSCVVTISSTFCQRAC